MFQSTCTPAINAAQFRSDFPEFTDTSLFPDSLITFWLAVATLFLNRCRWSTAYYLGLELYAAHNIAIEGAARQTAQGGGVPGMMRGVINAEGVGQVTISYDTVASAEPDAGNWNLTIYGSRYIRMVRMFGAGPIQVGPGGSLPGTVAGLYNGPGPAWSGPPGRPGKIST